MFSLIVVIISIALVALLALATIYYGGTAYSNYKASAEASALTNQASQLYAASLIYKQSVGTWPATPNVLLNTLPDGSQPLNALPVPPQGTLAMNFVREAIAQTAKEWEFVMDGNQVLTFIALKEAVKPETCLQVKLKAEGNDSLLSKTYTEAVADIKATLQTQITAGTIKPEDYGFQRVGDNDWVLNETEKARLATLAVIPNKIDPGKVYQCVDEVFINTEAPANQAYTYFWKAPSGGNTCGAVTAYNTGNAKALGCGASVPTEPPVANAPLARFNPSTLAITGTPALGGSVSFNVEVTGTDPASLFMLVAVNGAGAVQTLEDMGITVIENCSTFVSTCPITLSVAPGGTAISQAGLTLYGVTNYGNATAPFSVSMVPAVVPNEPTPPASFGLTSSSRTCWTYESACNYNGGPSTLTMSSGTFDEVISIRQELYFDTQTLYTDMGPLPQPITYNRGISIGDTDGSVDFLADLYGELDGFYFTTNSADEYSSGTLGWQLYRSDEYGGGDYYLSTTVPGDIVVKTTLVKTNGGEASFSETWRRTPFGIAPGSGPGLDYFIVGQATPVTLVGFGFVPGSTVQLCLPDVSTGDYTSDCSTVGISSSSLQVSRMTLQFNWPALMARVHAKYGRSDSYFMGVVYLKVQRAEADATGGTGYMGANIVEDIPELINISPANMVLQTGGVATIGLSKPHTKSSSFALDTPIHCITSESIVLQQGGSSLTAVVPGCTSVTYDPSQYVYRAWSAPWMPNFRYLDIRPPIFSNTGGLPWSLSEKMVTRLNLGFVDGTIPAEIAGISNSTTSCMCKRVGMDGTTIGGSTPEPLVRAGSISCKSGQESLCVSRPNETGSPSPTPTNASFTFIAYDNCTFAPIGSGCGGSDLVPDQASLCAYLSTNVKGKVTLPTDTANPDLNAEMAQLNGYQTGAVGGPSSVCNSLPRASRTTCAWTNNVMFGVSQMACSYIDASSGTGWGAWQDIGPNPPGGACPSDGTCQSSTCGSAGVYGIGHPSYNNYCIKHKL